MDCMDERESRRKEIKDVAYKISFLKKENLRLLKSMSKFQSGKLRIIDKIFLGYFTRRLKEVENNLTSLKTLEVRMEKIIRDEMS